MSLPPPPTPPLSGEVRTWEMCENCAACEGFALTDLIMVKGSICKDCREDVTCQIIDSPESLAREAGKVVSNRPVPEKRQESYSPYS